MKAKLLIVFLSVAVLTGCCSTGTGGCTSCGGCNVGYWSTSCYIPNSCGASEAVFQDIGSVCNGPCGNVYYTSGCWTTGCSTNW